MHSHVLPCADHGSHSVEESVKMIEAACAVGIDTVVATPHFYPQKHTVEGFLERRDKAFEKLAAALSGTPLESIKIVKAAEVNLQVGLIELDGLEKLKIGDTDYILIEMPDGRWTEWVYDAIYRLQAERKLKPLIAHIDRCDFQSLDRLLEMDVAVQMNALPLSTVSGRMRVKKYIGRVHVLGSDAHTDEDGKVPEYAQFAKAIKFLGERADTITENSRFILGI